MGAEGVVVPVLQVADVGGADLDHQPAVFQADLRFAVQLVGVGPGVILEGK